MINVPKLAPWKIEVFDQIRLGKLLSQQKESDLYNSENGLPKRKLPALTKLQEKLKNEVLIKQ